MQDFKVPSYVGEISPEVKNLPPEYPTLAEGVSRDVLETMWTDEHADEMHAAAQLAVTCLMTALRSTGSLAAEVDLNHVAAETNRIAQENRVLQELAQIRR